MIYFFECRESAWLHPNGRKRKSQARGPIKIGYSETFKGVKERLTSCQTGCPYELAIIAIRAGTKEDETALHEKLANYSIRGEWFQGVGHVEAEIRHAQEWDWHLDYPEPQYTYGTASDGVTYRKRRRVPLLFCASTEAGGHYWEYYGEDPPPKFCPEHEYLGKI